MEAEGEREGEGGGGEGEGGGGEGEGRGRERERERERSQITQLSSSIAHEVGGCTPTGETLHHHVPPLISVQFPRHVSDLQAL